MAATVEQKIAFFKWMMAREPERAFNAIWANTSAANKNAILAALTLTPEEELAQLESFQSKYVGGDPDLFAAVEARIAEIKGA